MDRLTLDLYAHAAANVPVSGNPSLSTNPFFTLAIEHDLDPYDVLTYLNIDIDTEECKTKVWTWRRFGQTHTVLPDGRVIFIGGEHEDWYDPLFFIFNDVVVYHPQSQSYELYRYPMDVFPPTDFHSATLLGDSIWIVGNLGYKEHRGDVTPVYRLDVNTLMINKVEIDGDDNPGWINDHTAEAKGEDIIEITDNEGTWELDISHRKWRKLGYLGRVSIGNHSVWG